MKDNKKHKKAEYGILITGLIILLAATCVIALCAGQYSVSVPEVIKILASRFVHLNSFGVQAMAFVAGILAVGLTLFIPRLIKNTNMTMLVLSGIIVKGIMDSVMGIIKYVADPETELQSITYWQLGSLTKVLPRDLFTVGPVIIAASVIIFLLRWRINILSLGDREAKTLGVSVTVVRNFIIICATLLTASAVCISGFIISI